LNLYLIGKKNTKIYKAEHLPTGKIYAIKEVEAKTLEKLNEYKVSLNKPLNRALNFDPNPNSSTIYSSYPTIGFKLLGILNLGHKNLTLLFANWANQTNI